MGISAIGQNRRIKKLLSLDFLQLIILIASFGALFYHTIVELVRDWFINPNYSHGFLIPVITGYMIWEKRKEIHSLPLNPSNTGLLVIVAGLLLHLLGSIGAEFFTMRIAVIVIILGISLYLLGGKITKKLMIPIAYLIFMIPIPAIIWNKIAFPLQIFASKMAEMTIRAVGITVLREGNIIYLANTTLEVVDACSGLRSLTALLALSTAFAYLSSHSWFKKWVLLLSAIPIAILVNIIRLSVTAYLASRFGEKIAQGLMHEFSGLLIYILALIMLTGVHIILSRIGHDKRCLLKK